MKTSYIPIEIAQPETPGAQDDEKWYFSGAPVAVQQGWKLYISAIRPNFLETLVIARSVFERHGIAFKYARSDKVLRKLNAGLYGYSQVGKVIVGYAQTEAQLAAAVRELKELLRKFAGQAPVIPFAMSLGGELPIYYRYGAFAGDTIEIGGEARTDERRKHASWVCALLGDPLADLREPEPDHADFDRFLGRFPIYEVLGQGGKGGIFAALDLEADECRDLVLKIGYRHGQVLPDGRDGMDFLRHELRFFELLRQRGIAHLAPEQYEYYEFAHRNVLVMERIEGDNLQQLKHGGKLERRHLEACIDTLRTIHANGLYVGDAKIANFVGTEDGAVRVIDFESAGEIEAARVDMLCTFHFDRPKFRDMATFERVHLLYSVLHRELQDSFSESDRIIDLPARIAETEPSDDVERWAHAQLRAELERTGG